MVKVSVVVPVYNASAYLAQCMDSLVRQTLSDIEVICINDGSTDDSSEILKKYAAEDGRFRVISQENRGVSAARNRGMAEAQGKYIGFVDADDWISPDFYEKLYQAARQFLRTFIVQNNIEVELPYDKKVKFYIFGFPLLKVLEGSRYKKYYFCGVKFMQAQIVSKV